MMGSHQSYSLLYILRPSGFLGTFTWQRMSITELFQFTLKTNPYWGCSGIAVHISTRCFSLAPKIFSALADGLQWILVQNGIAHLFHYFDDLAASIEEGSRQKDIFMSTCSRLGVCLEISKFHLLTFRGIKVDTVANQLHLPVRKLLKLKQELTPCLHRKSITKCELEV